MNDPYVYNYKGKPAGRLNERLAKSQNVTPEQLENLKALHMLKLDVFKAMEKTDDPEELKIRARQVEAIEFQLQANWNFTLDKTYHEWYKVPKCKCPHYDNQERRGTDLSVRNQDCPIHGW